MAWWKIFAGLVFVTSPWILMILFPGQKIIPADRSASGGPEIVLISIAPFGRILLWTSIASAVLLFAISIVGIVRNQRRLPAITLLTVVLGCPASCGLYVSQNLGTVISPWTISDQIVLGDGTTYVLCYHYGRDAPGMGICRQLKKNFWGTRLALLDTTSGDWRYSEKFTTPDGIHVNPALKFGEMERHKSGEFLALGLSRGVAYFDLDRELLFLEAPEKLELRGQRQ